MKIVSLMSVVLEMLECSSEMLHSRLQHVSSESGMLVRGPTSPETSCLIAGVHRFSNCGTGTTRGTWTLSSGTWLPCRLWDFSTIFPSTEIRRGWAWSLHPPCTLSKKFENHCCSQYLCYPFKHYNMERTFLELILLYTQFNNSMIYLLDAIE